MPLKAKARLCVQGQFDPDCASGEVKVDAPTIQKVTFVTFLHLCASFGWINTLRAGDVSSAFLQGGESSGELLFMEQPAEGIPGMERGQLLRLKKPVYGRPDAPRAWFDEFSRVLTTELGFERSCLDPSWFILRDSTHCPVAMLTLHVDDVMIAGDGSRYSESVIDRLHRRFPFGEWSNVAKEKKVRYCGKEVCVEERNGNQCIVLRQRDFVLGKLDSIPLSSDRKRQSDSAATGQERTDFRSTIGSLQWLSTQSRPDISFEVNQLQKRIPDLKVFDLQRANALVHEVKASDAVELVFENLGKECEVVVFHDAALFNSVGLELEAQEADHVLLSGKEKRLVYSQKGVLVGCVRKGSTANQGLQTMNILEWKSSTNRRVVDSSFAAESHAAVQGHSLGRHVQALMSEFRWGSKIVCEFDDKEWQERIPMYMCTDCKSLYDCVKKEGCSLSDRSYLIGVVLLRQLCGIRSRDRTNLMWVPTRLQRADPLTKKGLGKQMRRTLNTAKFQGESLKQLRKCSDQRRIAVSAKGA